MKITVEKGEFLKALTIVKGAIGNSSIIPIIEGVHLVAKDNVLTLRGTDLDKAVSCSIAYIGEDVEFNVVVSLLVLETLKSLPEQPLILEVADNCFTITTLNGEFKTPTELGSDFPNMQVLENAKTATISNFKAFLAILKEAVPFASTDDMRPAMTAISVKVEGGKVEVCATDAHILYMNPTLELEAEDMQFLLPAKFVKLLEGLPVGEEGVLMEYSGTNINFTSGETTVQCRLIDGRFPDYHAAIPKGDTVWVEMSVDGFKALLRQTGSYTNATTKTLKLSTQNMSNEFEAHAVDVDKDREAKVKEKLIENGFELAIGFNSQKLFEICGKFNSDRVNILASKPNKAALFQDQSRPDVVFLCMPVMIN